ncbi:MAG: hypothetical protein FMNOHCHN_03487 [Ignavibacteriaceae bacterium]|nr:hypothetical protein [Ignavibacteriaceae bacterium]
MKDKRWTITKEFCGAKKAMWILRFCGDWIDKYSSKKKAITARKERIVLRQKLLD